LFQSTRRIATTSTNLPSAVGDAVLRWLFFLTARVGILVSLNRVFVRFRHDRPWQWMRCSVAASTAKLTKNNKTICG
ncbi:hypothetical protein, partial [Bradyrhizobium liaoningense]|uniref:hypothetical protein n=1 Tax=Bradyrhizobium liaoningense TaxID=43992 RepID=UPI001AEBE95D